MVCFAIAAALAALFLFSGCANLDGKLPLPIEAEASYTTRDGQTLAITTDGRVVHIAGRFTQLPTSNGYKK